ncbi:MAG: hypothetical protein J0653_05475, partial [Deltaproteobacteria bacterium]|nr:hypothetical protein [Deltaproteobacteria bacterium]
IYPVAEVPSVEAKSSPRFQSIRHLEYGQHTWTLVIDALPEYRFKSRDDKPAWVVAIGGLLSLLIISLMAWTIQHHRQSIKAELIKRAEVEKAAHIEEQNQIKRKLLESERDLHYSQQLARVGSYVADLKTQSWRSSPILDDIFGIDETFNRTIVNWCAMCRR